MPLRAAGPGRWGADTAPHRLSSASRVQTKFVRTKEAMSSTDIRPCRCDDEIRRHKPLSTAICNPITDAAGRANRLNFQPIADQPLPVAAPGATELNF